MDIYAGEMRLRVRYVGLSGSRRGHVGGCVRYQLVMVGAGTALSQHGGECRTVFRSEVWRRPERTRMEGYGTNCDSHVDVQTPKGLRESPDSL
jgi:hypothetical protein